MSIPLDEITPEVIDAVEDALEYHLGDLLGHAEATPRQIAIECLRQAVCASVKPRQE